MWLQRSIVAEVNRVARIDYIDSGQTKLWNERRKDGELRALTGWCWTAKDGSGRYAQRLKTQTACYIDAAETLLDYAAVAPTRRSFLRVVATRKVA